MGWKELPISNEDIKQFALVDADELMKFLVEIECNDRIIETTIFKQYNAPDLENVFKDLVQYARSSNNTTFSEFCTNYGYDSDSIKVFNFYKFCKNEKKKVLYLLGEQTFKLFMECDFD